MQIYCVSIQRICMMNFLLNLTRRNFDIAVQFIVTILYTSFILFVVSYSKSIPTSNSFIYTLSTRVTLLCSQISRVS